MWLNSLEWFREESRLAVVWLFALLAVLLTVVTGRFRPPGGYLALELPAFELRGTVPVSQWTPDQRERAFFGLGLDYLYLVIYPLALSLLCGWAGTAGNLPGWLAAACRALSPLVLFAGLADAAENVGVYRQMIGKSSRSIDVVTTVVSLVKWGLVTVTVVVALLALGVLGFRAAFGKAGS